MGGGVTVESIGKLRDRRRYFKAEVEDLLLTLQADIFRPLYHAREVASWLDVLAYAEVAGTLFDEGILHIEGIRLVL